MEEHLSQQAAPEIPRTADRNEPEGGERPPKGPHRYVPSVADLEVGIVHGAWVDGSVLDASPTAQTTGNVLVFKRPPAPEEEGRS